MTLFSNRKRARGGAQFHFYKLWLKCKLTWQTPTFPDLLWVPFLRKQINLPEIPAEKIPRKNRREAFQSDFLDRMFNEVNLFSGEEERNTWKDFFQSDFDFFFRFNVATDFLKRKNNKTKKLANFGLFFCFIFHPATNSDSDSNSGRLDASCAQ